MNMHYDLDEIPCPRCDGEGGWWEDLDYDDLVWEDTTWHICPRCKSTGTIMIKIEKEKDAK